MANTFQDYDGREDIDDSGVDPKLQRLMNQSEALRDINTLKAVLMIKDALAWDDYETAVEVQTSMPEAVQTALWIAPSNGGIFTTEERAKLKSNDFSAARKEYHSKEKEA